MQVKDVASLKKELRNARAISECANEFSMVGDPTRLTICYLLCRHKELSVGEIAGLTDVSISAVSRTLKKLKETDIVAMRRDFRMVYYHLKPSPFTTFLRNRLCA